VTGDILQVCDKLQISEESSLDINYIGSGNVWIKNSYNMDSVYLARNMIAEAIQKTAPGQLMITGFDSNLSGVFAPFATLSSGAAKQLELLTDIKALDMFLDYVWQHIQAVQNVIQGRNDTLSKFRKEIGRPVESYKLIVLSLNMSIVEEKFMAKLSSLMRVGPAAGVSFLIISTINLSKGLVVTDIASNITIVEVSKNTVSLVPEGASVLYTPLGAADIIACCENFLKQTELAALPTVRFDEINDFNTMWAHTSENGVSFAIGKYGVNDVEITIGDEVNQRHNMLITGAVGQGKSNLISVIIHSLCQRYSPRELNLYLLDFKEGVTLKPFANIGQEEYLPHAKALGLESDVGLGMAVLEFLYDEYLRRLKIFKTQNVKSIKEFRQTYPEFEMPRLLVIIDEFQLMFGDDVQTGQKIVSLLEKSVRLFRAAGIHFILASQGIAGNATIGEKMGSIFN